MISSRPGRPGTSQLADLLGRDPDGGPAGAPRGAVIKTPAAS
jgi:hypothetical protein